MVYPAVVPGGDFQRIFEALAAEKVRYLVAGGVAVVLHGHPRFTVDLDLIVALDRDNVLAALRALDRLGFRPRAPVAAEEFADAERRRKWVREKGLRVFSLWSAAMPGTEVDLFVEEPFPYEEGERRSVGVTIGNVRVRVVSLEDLIRMKRSAGRPKDRMDVEALLAIRRESGEAGDGELAR